VPFTRWPSLVSLVSSDFQTVLTRAVIDRILAPQDCRTTSRISSRRRPLLGSLERRVGVSEPCRGFGHGSQTRLSSPAAPFGYCLRGQYRRH